MLDIIFGYYLRQKKSTLIDLSGIQLGFLRILKKKKHLFSQLHNANEKNMVRTTESMTILSFNKT